ncbi:hypothetical protein E3N88_37725 [Mikania micrantha]|uniref:PB1-like domain-containing protein n=1 Tax=Mikania micrantha TaxID=192012 RepID=A0A5N6LRZ3_9ASTR|nr:hypothetical protein E3N88_37725 [Mikania micrantha]
MGRRLWCIRENGAEFDYEIIYGHYDELFSIKIHHGGRFTKFPNRSYVDGQVSYADLFDREHFSVFELNKLVTELGYPRKEIMFYHYKIPDQDLNFGLRALENDADVVGFLKFVNDNWLMNVYIEHKKTEVECYLFSPNAACMDNIIPAGFPRKPVTTKDDLFNINAGIVKILRCS